MRRPRRTMRIRRWTRDSYLSKVMDMLLGTAVTLSGM